MTSQNSSRTLTKRKMWLILLLPLWTYGVFMSLQFLVAYLAQFLVWVGVPLVSINPVVFNAVFSAIVYGLAIVLVIWLPWRIKKSKTTRDDIGLTGPLSWLDIGLTPVVMIGYMILSGIVISVASSMLPIDMNQSQALPVDASMLVTNWQYVVAFLMLVILAPVGEELLFRGYLYGKLRKSAPIWVAVLVTSLTFGLAHLWTGGDGPLQWAVAIDTFVLSLVMCSVREYTGAIWITIFMHMTKNGLAFYLLFVNPQFVDQIKAALLPLL